MALDDIESPEERQQRHERMKRVGLAIAGSVLIVIGTIFIALGKYGPKALASGRNYITKARKKMPASSNT